MLVFTGIGSRLITLEEKNKIEEISKVFSSLNFTLRSGGAEGSDLAFESSFISSKKEIYIPWKGFNNSTSNLYPENVEHWDEAEQIASKAHPRWNYLKSSIKKLHTRNVYQVLGADLNSPSDFIIYCADENEQGEVMGGTGQAIRVSNLYDIPKINVRTQREALNKIIKSFEERYKINL